MDDAKQMNDFNFGDQEASGQSTNFNMGNNQGNNMAQSAVFSQKREPGLGESAFEEE